MWYYLSILFNRLHCLAGGTLLPLHPKDYVEEEEDEADMSSEIDLDEERLEPRSDDDDT